MINLYKGVFIMCNKKVILIMAGILILLVAVVYVRSRIYAERHVRWCERSVNMKIGDKHL